MRFISFASNIGPAAAVPAGPAPTPLIYHESLRSIISSNIVHTNVTLKEYITVDMYLCVFSCWCLQMSAVWMQWHRHLQFLPRR